ncbi:MAG: hypothetical protein P9M14_17350 [Candidatus Alcyoniella australis]|nr:hypothetical protein [Candidatus Alcyoniella australis]
MERRKLPCPVCGAPVGAESAICMSCGCRFQIEFDKSKAEGMTCFECGNQSDQLDRSCPQCGREYQVECPECGFEYAPNERFCPQCQHDRLADRDRELYDVHSAADDRRSGFKLKLGMLLPFAIMTVVLIVSTKGEGWVAASALVVLAAVALFIVSGVGERLSVKTRPMVRGSMVEVYRTYNMSRSDHLVALLESEGIAAHSEGRQLSALGFSVFNNGFHVLVSRDKLTQTLELMSAFDFKTDLQFNGMAADSAPGQNKEENRR